MKKLGILYRRSSNPQIDQSILNISFEGNRVKTLTFTDFIKNASGTVEAVTEAVELFHDVVDGGDIAEDATDAVDTDGAATFQIHKPSL